MRRRAEQVDQTRQRIVEATVALHGSVGPAATTIAAIAEKAGVTRLTVYRHFPDDDALFGACSAHWISRQQLPDPGAWSQIGDPAARLRAGLADLYRFYRAGADVLTCLYRDLAALAEEYQQALRDQDTLFGDVLTAPFGSADSEHRRLRAHRPCDLVLDLALPVPRLGPDRHRGSRRHDRRDPRHHPVPHRHNRLPRQPAGPNSHSPAPGTTCQPVPGSPPPDLHLRRHDGHA